MRSTRMLAVALAATTGLAACSDDAAPGDGKTYVLVAGAWMGASGWDDVATALRADGATVIVPELPAHGADPAPASSATLAGYVDRVSAAIDGAGGPVILAGHSMAGVVISQVAERRPADIARLVYVAAYLPTDGQGLFDLAMADPDSEIGPHLIFNPDGTAGVDPAAFPDLFCADCDADARAALVAGYRDEPGGPLAEKVALTAAFAGVAKTYVRTANDRVVSPALQAQMLAATPVGDVEELSTSHVPMLAAPAELEALLLLP